VLRLDQVHAGYGGVAVLHGVSLEVAEGESVALLGRNGAGKSTLLMTVCGLVPVSSGSVELDGRSIRGLHPSILVKQGVVNVPEGRRIFPELTVAENLALGVHLACDRRKAGQQIELMLDLFPILHSRYDSPGGVLSGGEQQMLAIARALVSCPRLLLLDEPSLGLSPAAADIIFDLLGGIARQGTTLLLVEQNTERALNLASRAYVMETGRIVVSGSSEEIRRDARLIDTYLGASDATGSAEGRGR